MNKKAVIFLDVDGTIVDADGNVPPSAAEAIRRAQENGHICVINTGRPFSHIVDSVHALGIKGYICACGQRIMIDGKVMKDEAISPEVSAAIIAEAKRCRVDLFIESEAGIYHSFVHPMGARMDAEFDRFRKRGFDVDASVEREGFFFSKICAWEREDSDMPRFLNFVSPYLYPIREEFKMYELVKNGCSKINGIKEFIKLCSLEAYETYAVGDSGNDEEMLMNVMHSAAMKNAPENVKKKVEFVTELLENDGLKKAFEYFGLI